MVSGKWREGFIHHGYPQPVLWIQGLASFCLWLAAGYVQARRAPAERVRLAGLGRSARVALGPVLMVVGAAFMLGALWFTALDHGLTTNGLAVWAWILITGAGTTFILAQSMAALMMISLASETEPAGGRQASEGRITDRNSDEVTNPSSP